MSRAKGMRRVRGMQAGIVVFEIGDCAFETLRGHAGFTFIPAACAVLIALAMLWLTRKIRQREYLDRPRPDYSSIAAMERDIYGETFEHEGAARTSGLDPQVAELHAMMDDLAERATARLSPCWCNYCKGRKGEHGAEAIALYRAECDEHRSNLRWTTPEER